VRVTGAGRYQQVGFAGGEQVLRVQRPFPVELVPARLVDPRLARPAISGRIRTAAGDTMTGTGIDPAITGEPPEERDPSIGAGSH
jgi:hypothetical protein